MIATKLGSGGECKTFSFGKHDRESKRFSKQKKRKSSIKKRIDTEKKRETMIGLTLVLIIIGVTIVFVGWYLSQQPPQEGTPSEPRVISVDDDPYRGPEDAPVTIVEFSDFQCSACVLAASIIENIANNVYAGQVKLVYRDFPVREIHSHADIAAEAAQSAFEQGRFWEYHDFLFERQSEWGDNLLTQEEVVTLLKVYAMELGLNMEEFSKSLEEHRYAEEVQNDRLDGLKYGIRGAPTFFINGEKIEGDDESAIKDAINRALGS